jgi:hypothetical protein
MQAWTIAGAIAAIVAAAGVIYEFILKPYCRGRALRRPCKAWFLIASLSQKKLSYALQDEQEHYVEELTLASNSEYEIDLAYVPRIAFEVSEIYFGFNKQDDRDLETKPVIKSYCNRFIERGISEESPETHPETNYVDHNKYYHLLRPRHIARRECYLIGYKVQTRKAGRYEFNLMLRGEEIGSPKNKLFVLVEDTPTTEMKCVLRKHRRAKCFVKPHRRNDAEAGRGDRG